MKHSWIFGLLIVAACLALPAWAKPIPVAITQVDGRYTLQRGGEPFFVNGVGGYSRLELLKATGGNTLRTWSARQFESIIEEAQEHGLAVVAGLWVEHERHGFDYDDAEAVARQIEEMKEKVDRLKDYPGLLMWGVGNEVELGYTNPKVWDTVEAVARYIQEVDPHRPVMCVIAYPDADKMAHLRERCPSLDLIGVNAYGGIHRLSAVLDAYGWNKPYLVTEWGPTGFWEGGVTDWGAELEATSTQKAMVIRQRYRYITDDPRCLGSFVFLWGQKQERTPTWFGMFLEDGSLTETVERMQHAWTGSLPDVLAPRISPLFIDGFQQQDFKGLRVPPGRSLTAYFQVYRGDPRELAVSWELLPESTDKRWGGDAEERPRTLDIAFDRRDLETVRFRAPADPGPYRLFVKVKGRGNKAATANIPFLVMEKE